MKASKNKKISLVKSSLYSIGLYAILLIMQLFYLIEDKLSFQSLFLGTVYVPLLISGIILLLVIVVGIFRVKQERKTEASDELAEFNNYKAGYITKYICILLIPIGILLLNYFHLLQEDDTVGNVSTVLFISLCITEIIHSIVFIVLEKKG